MSSAPGPVSILILDKEYLIACPPEEREDLLAAAVYLNARLREIREGGKVIGAERQVMMAALNMANDLCKSSGREQRNNTDTGARVKNMRERVERTLQQGRQLEL
ncbi:MAG: cell division protein ZapA [Pseudomonadota bacterium]